jgi:hypothetical protein
LHKRINLPLEILAIRPAFEPGFLLAVWLSFQHSLARLTQPVERNEKPIAARCAFECEEE